MIIVPVIPDYMPGRWYPYADRCPGCDDHVCLPDVQVTHERCVECLYTCTCGHTWQCMWAREQVR